MAQPNQRWLKKSVWQLTWVGCGEVRAPVYITAVKGAAPWPPAHTWSSPSPTPTATCPPLHHVIAHHHLNSTILDFISLNNMTWKSLPSSHKVVVLYSRTVHLRKPRVVVYDTIKKRWPEDSQQGETGSRYIYLYTPREYFKGLIMFKLACEQQNIFSL